MGHCSECHREIVENTNYINLTLHMDTWSHRTHEHRVKHVLSLCCRCALSRDFGKVTVVVPYLSPPLPQDGTAHCFDFEPPDDFWPDLEPPDDCWTDLESSDGPLYDSEPPDDDWL